MNKQVSSRQHQILNLLLTNRAGLSINEISTALNISRNAVQQHFTSLEQEGYIETGEYEKTAGRPVRKFVLTESAINYFPKQYAWFSELILADLQQNMGEQAFLHYFQKLGLTLSESLLPQFQKKSFDEKIEQLIEVMDSLGYQASYKQNDNSNEQYIEACNCVYHDLAQKYDAICELDKTLISTLLNSETVLEDCVAKGGHSCRFKIKPINM